MRRLMCLVMTSAVSFPSLAHEPGGINSAKSQTDAAFDLVHTHIYRDGNKLVFQQIVAGTAGVNTPKPTGKFAGSDVYSYVWPTSLDSDVVGFEPKSGILALALTSHPDFDDTPQLDENKDGKKDNDGGLWHSHWVVLTKEASCGPSGLKVRDIPKDMKPKMPATWPGVPLYIDSPGYELKASTDTVTIQVPLAAVGFVTTRDLTVDQD